MRSTIHGLIAVGLLVACNLTTTVQAAQVRFDFDFLDQSGALIGDGFYQFDDIAPGTQASFSSLTNFSWSLSIPSWSLAPSSASGYTAGYDTQVNEGIVLSGSPGARTLQFFDNNAQFILHSNAAGYPIGIDFLEFSQDFRAYLPTLEVKYGTFAATEVGAVPLPAAAWLLLSGLGGLGLLGRRSTN